MDDEDVDEEHVEDLGSIVHIEGEPEVDFKNWGLQIHPWWYGKSLLQQDNEGINPLVNLDVRVNDLPSPEVKLFLQKMMRMQNYGRPPFFPEEVPKEEKVDIIMNYLNQDYHYALVDYTILTQAELLDTTEEKQKKLNQVIQRCLKNSKELYFIPKCGDTAKYWSITNLPESLQKRVLENIYTSTDPDIKQKFGLFLGRRLKYLAGIYRINYQEEFNNKFESVKIILNEAAKLGLEPIEPPKRPKFGVGDECPHCHDNTLSIMCTLCGEVIRDNQVASINKFATPNLFKLGLDIYNKKFFPNFRLPTDIDNEIKKYLFGHRRRRSKHKRSKHKRSKHKRSKHKRSKHKRSKRRKSKKVLIN